MINVKYFHINELPENLQELYWKDYMAEYSESVYLTAPAYEIGYIVKENEADGWGDDPSIEKYRQLDNYLISKGCKMGEKVFISRIRIEAKQDNLFTMQLDDFGNGLEIEIDENQFECRCKELDAVNRICQKCSGIVPIRL